MVCFWGARKSSVAKLSLNRTKKYHKKRRARVVREKAAWSFLTSRDVEGRGGLKSGGIFLKIQNFVDVLVLKNISPKSSRQFSCSELLRFQSLISKPLHRFYIRDHFLAHSGVTESTRFAKIACD